MTTNETTATTSVSVPTVTGIRAVRLLMQLAGPSVVAGAIARRHSTLPLLEKVQADASTPRLVSGLRDEFGSGPLLLDLPGRRVVVLLDREDASRVLDQYAARAEMPSLIAAVNQTSAAPSVDPIGQVPHWLFAFDAAGIVTIRALALLATHPRQRARALEEIDETDPRHPSRYPFLRACVLESARLWPTAPVILRDSIAPTTWPTERGVAEIPTDSAFIILTAAFHRDPQNVPFADVFTPDAWLDGRADTQAFMPFSGGPAVCPGQNFALFVATTALANLLRGNTFELDPRTGLTADAAVPATLNHYSLRFRTKPARRR